MNDESTQQLWLENRDAGPLLATAVHAGHEIRGELLPLIALDESEACVKRIRTQIIGLKSFQRG